MTWWRRERGRETAVTVEPGPPSPAPPRESGWWFAPADAAARAGTTERFDGVPVPGRAGLHAARTILDALPYAKSSRLCRVVLAGRIETRDALLAATERTIERCVDPRALVRSIAIEIARDVLAGAVLDDALHEAIDALARAPIGSVNAALLATAEHTMAARAENAERRLDDLAWRMERASASDTLAREASDARREAARARAHRIAMETLVALDRRGRNELEAMLDGAMRALAWIRVSEDDDITSAALDRALERVRRERGAELDARASALLATATDPEPEPEAPPAAARVSAPEPAPAAIRVPLVAEPESLEIAARLGTSMWSTTMPPPRGAAFAPITDQPVDLGRPSPARVWEDEIVRSVRRYGAVAAVAIVELRAAPVEIAVVELSRWGAHHFIERSLRHVEHPSGAPTLSVLVGARELAHALERQEVRVSPELVPVLYPAHPDDVAARRRALIDAVGRAWRERMLYVAPPRRDPPVASSLVFFTPIRARCTACHALYLLPSTTRVRRAVCACGARELVASTRPACRAARSRPSSNANIVRTASRPTRPRRTTCARCANTSRTRRGWPPNEKRTFVALARMLSGMTSPARRVLTYARGTQAGRRTT